eukprot:CAMPEP_0116550262 /NCGR_PEP_ID=MMETSP0397-20121206/5332_1 /TAXON_ID=216820 /ORGANISM="Cyclophora tenuis, Strain ECT3854" /LENGTH=73 /DNA_ID=CAMNT_0004075079 /DNA_START=8 /DNA_END=226 /DNA_ORIENTATION=+
MPEGGSGSGGGGGGGERRRFFTRNNVFDMLDAAVSDSNLADEIEAIRSTSQRSLVNTSAKSMPVHNEEDSGGD